MGSEKYIELNKNLWDSKVDVHVQSDFYDQESFLKGRSSLNSIELDSLGDVKGKKMLHLHCHFGQDTLSLARMGAEVTGSDFSAEALKVARETNEKLGLNAKFVEADTMHLPPELLQGEYDWVFASYGVVGWLPDMEILMNSVSKALKPGGRFLLVEFHPFVWMYDDDFTKLQYPYSSSSPIEILEEGSYTDGDEGVKGQTMSWNHSLSDIFNPMISSGLQIIELQEYNYSPYNCFSHMEEVGKGRYAIPKLSKEFPLVYKVCGQKTKA
ncbi:MAG: class I SAM-dependent methyltransferase [Schleiferiaceae bacterium]